MTRYALLDFDNTLTATENLILPPFLNLLEREYGIALTEEHFYTHFLGKGGVKLFKAIAAHFDIEIDCDDLLIKRRRLNEDLLVNGKLEVASGAIGALQRLSEAGFQFAIVTNSTEDNIYKKFDLLNGDEGEQLRAFVGQYIFSAYDAGRQKPDPYGYLQAIEFFGIGAGDIVFAVEDSGSGVEAALTAGIEYVYGYTGLTHPELQEQSKEKLQAKGCRSVFSDWANFWHVVSEDFNL